MMIGPLLVFGSVDSTQTTGSVLKQHGIKTPFAVLSLKQNQGRGRLGHTWDSPEGNMYLSVFLRTEDLGGFPLEFLSLKVGLLLAKWLREIFHLHITLKWPNDLLVSGKKLGGILCESSQLGNSTEIAIGVGMNVFLAPNPEQNACLNALADLASVHHTIPLLAQSLLQYWQQTWGTISPKILLEEYSHYGLDRGQLWYDQDGYYTVEGLHPQNGSLLLTRLGNGREQVELLSAHHTGGWAYQRKIPSDIQNPLLLLTSQKLMYFSSPWKDAPDQEWELDSSLMQNPLQLLKKLDGPILRSLPAPGWPVYTQIQEEKWLQTMRDVLLQFYLEVFTVKGGEMGTLDPLNKRHETAENRSFSSFIH